MRAIFLAGFLFVSVLVSIPIAATAQPSVPLGKLSDAAKPTAYRIDMTIVPDQPRFSGHDEIDATLKAPTTSLYLHGRGLNVTKAIALVGGKRLPRPGPKSTAPASRDSTSLPNCRPVR